MPQETLKKRRFKKRYAVLVVLLVGIVAVSVPVVRISLATPGNVENASEKLRDLIDAAQPADEAGPDAHVLVRAAIERLDAAIEQIQVRLVRAYEDEGYDAWFDYCDRWMADPDPWAAGRGGIERPDIETVAFEDWVTAMWRRYRAETAEVAMSGDSRRWLWTMEDGKATGPGWWEDNPRPEGLVIPNAAGTPAEE